MSTIANIKDMYKWEREIKERYPKLLTQREILDKIQKVDGFKIDLAGHCYNGAAERIRQDIIRDLTFGITYPQDEINKLREKPTLTKEEEGTLQWHIDCLKLFETRKIRQNDNILLVREGIPCGKCGRTLPYVLLDENTIGLGPDYHMLEEAFEKGHTELPDATCPFADGLKPKETTIPVTSGELAFVNFFDDRKPKEWANDTCYDKSNYYPDDPLPVEIFEPKDKYMNFSLNDHQGRINMMNWYSKQFGIAYAQMGNMSIGLWINKTKDKVIIGNPYEEELPEFRNLKKQGFSYIGDIDCSMWRWMAADMDVVRKYELPIDDKVKEIPEGRVCGEIYDRNHTIILNVKPGTWKVTHYYDSDERRDFLYSVLELVA